MKRKKREESAFNWPVIGIDLPYPEHVRQALKLVEAETQRRLRETCEHEQAHSTGSFRATYRGMWDNSWHCITCGYDWTTHDRRSVQPYTTWREWRQLMKAERERRRNCKHERTQRRLAHRRLDRGLHADKGLETFCLDCEMVLGFEAEPPRYSTPVLGFSYASEDIPTIRRVDGTPVLIAPAEAEAELTAQFDRIYHRGNADGFTDTMIQQLETLADHVDQARQRRAGRLRESYEGWGNDLSLPDRDTERQGPDGTPTRRTDHQRSLALASSHARRQAGYPRR